MISLSAPGLALPDSLLEDLRRIRDAALSSSYAYEQTAYLCNHIGHRLSGSPQAEEAVRYVAEELRRLDTRVALEEVPVPHWVRGREEAWLIDFPEHRPGTEQKLVLTTLGGSVATPEEGLSATLVVVRDFDELERLDRGQVEGKIVVFNHPFDIQMAQVGRGGHAYGDAVDYRVDGAVAAARKGAVAALVRSAGGAEYRLAHTGSVRYDDNVPKIPSAAVAVEDAKLMEYLAAKGPVTARLVLTPSTFPDATSHNVIGDIVGRERPDQIVIVSGHLDSWDVGTGALDDASGVAMAMETANLLRKLKLRPRRTIRVVAWMNEENGLKGGRTYAEGHQAEIALHVGAIESDLGGGHPLGFYGKTSPAALEMLAPVGRILGGMGAGIVEPSAWSAADISPLSKLGVPCFSPLQDSRTYFDYHHTMADTFDKVNPRWLAENSAVMAVLAYALAEMPEPLPRE
ncbi:MAG: M20/M25/M40 family metallo-hydrolase [Armatimonadetes bacterium]|nr:M20/M25/M40 family metallo-hydrolase [Armatimonadota bacterium]